MRYIPFRHISSIFWKRRPIQLTLFITRQCNAGCRFCFYLSKDRVQGDAELSLSEIEKVSGSLGSLLWLALSGGETFLRQDIVEIVEAFYRNNRPAFILIPTNGLLTDVIYEKTREVLKRCPKSTVVLKLSLDGPAGLHDALRGIPGAFHKTLETYRRLRPLLDTFRNFELGINTVFCSGNQCLMDGIIKFVRSLDGIRTHTISMIRGEVQDRMLKDIDTEKYLSASEELGRGYIGGDAALYRFSGALLKAAQDILQRRLIYQTALLQKRLISCYAGRLNIVITESGDVYPCESFGRKMGNVREFGHDVRGLLKSGPAREAARSIREGGCHCTHECYMMTNILFNPLLYPALFREYIRLCLTSRNQACSSPHPA